MNLYRFSFLLIVLACVLAIAPAAQAASIKERMAARIPEINSLKDKGIIGENNKGFLEYRSAEKPSQKVIAAENADRATTYKAIGQKRGLSPGMVGELRAKQIIENGKSGHWYQKPNGEWYRK